MDTALLQELQHTLDLLAQAKACIDGSAAHLRCVTADLSTTVTRLRGSTLQASRHDGTLGSSQQGAVARGQPAAGMVQTDSRASTQQKLLSSSTSRKAPPAARLQGAQQQQQQQQQQQHQQAAAAVPVGVASSSSTQPQLPADFVRLQQLYASMQGHSGPKLAGSVEGEAAAGFLHSLQAAYGGASQHQQQNQQQPVAPQTARSVQQPSSTMLSVQAFADQADFVGLVAAVLSAVQGLTAANSSSSSSGGGCSAQLAGAVPALLQQCEARLGARRPAAQPGGVASTADLQRQQQYAEAVRWRNRALRSITAGPPAASTPAASAPPAAAVAGLWLPQHCWDPLRSSSGALPGQTGWQVVLPQQVGPSQPQHQQGMPAQQQQQLPGHRPPVLTYSDLSEVIHHSRQVQKLQQLLLQYAVESGPVPKLLGLLLQCCQELQQQAASAAPTASAAHGDAATHGRCCALYRLLYALAAGPVKQRGLGAACQLAVVGQEGDVL